MVQRFLNTIVVPQVIVIASNHFQFIIKEENPLISGNLEVTERNSLFPGKERMENSNN